MVYHEIVVGIDGSGASRQALLWAAAEAAQRNVPLRVLLAYHPGPPGVAPISRALFLRAGQEQVDRVVADALAAARQAAPGIEVTGAAVPGSAAPTLLAAAHSDSLLVVGSREHHDISAALLGSVSQQVTAHAPGAVAVIRGDVDRHTGPVVVGVDGSAASEQALGVAFDHAETRAAPLVVVRAFTPPSPPSGADPRSTYYDPTAAETRLRSELYACLEPWREKYPQVRMEEHLVVGRPAAVLVEFSRRAGLVVVGSRGHGGFAGLLLGSVSQRVINHSDCPTVVVHTSSTSW